MTPRRNADIRSLLIVGFGFLGRRVGRIAVELGYEVTATSRRESRRAEIEAAGCRFARYDLNGADDRLPAHDAWVWCPAFDRSAGVTVREAVVTGLMRALERAEAAPRHVVFTSTTSVYGQSAGEWVDESTPCEPRTESGRAHVEAETLLRDWAAAHGRAATILRLSGLYGPERVIRRAAIEAGQPIACLPDTWLNLLHGDDAATACLNAIEKPGSATYCITDDRPVLRREYYEALARLLNAPEPRFAAPSASEETGHKRVSNRLAKQGLGWEPRYADCISGLAMSLSVDEMKQP